MYCAQCRAEYREGFTECSTCSIPLIEGPPPQPEPDGIKWTPETPLGSPGTRLIYLYMAHALIVGVAIVFRGPQIGGLSVFGAFCGVASILSIFSRRKVALHLVYAFLATTMTVSILAVLQTQDVMGGASFIVGQVVGGIFLPIAWFFYFLRRRNLFA